MNEKTSDRWLIGLCLALCPLLIVLSRVGFSEIPNFKPVAAISLFAGMFLRDARWAVAIPLVGLMVSDWLLGFSEPVLIPAVYLSTVLNVVIGRQLLASRYQPSVATRVVQQTMAVLLGSCQFFWITNLAVWAGTTWYPQNAAGLLQCLVNAIPFWKFSLASDFLFAWLPLMAGTVLPVLWRSKKARDVATSCPPAISNTAELL